MKFLKILHYVERSYEGINFLMALTFIVIGVTIFFDAEIREDLNKSIEASLKNK